MLENDVIYGKPLKDWDKQWQHVGLLNKDNIIAYKGIIGIYKIYYGSEKVYIGKGIELNGKGLYKRLNDYIRKSESARNSKTGNEIHDNLENATFDVLVIGTDWEAAVAATYLENYYIYIQNPKSNIHGKKSNK